MECHKGFWSLMLLKLRHCNCCSNLWSGTRQKCSCDVWLFVCHCIWSIWSNRLSNSYPGSVKTFSGLVCSNPTRWLFFTHGPHATLKVWLSLVHLHFWSMWRNVLGSQTNMWDATRCGVGESPCFLLFLPSIWGVRLTCAASGLWKSQRSEIRLSLVWMMAGRVEGDCTCAAFVIPWCSDDTAKIEKSKYIVFDFCCFQTPNLSPIIFKNVDNNIPQIPWLLDFKTPFRVARKSQNLAETIWQHSRNHLGIGHVWCSSDSHGQECAMATGLPCSFRVDVGPIHHVVFLYFWIFPSCSNDHRQM